MVALWGRTDMIIVKVHITRSRPKQTWIEAVNRDMKVQHLAVNIIRSRPEQTRIEVVKRKMKFHHLAMEMTQTDQREIKILFT